MTVKGTRSVTTNIALSLCGNLRHGKYYASSMTAMQVTLMPTGVQRAILRYQVGQSHVTQVCYLRTCFRAESHKSQIPCHSWRIIH